MSHCRLKPPVRSKFASIPGVTSLPLVPLPPARRPGVVDGDPGAGAPQVAVSGGDDDGAGATRLVALESRVAVAEKSTRALLVEVVRLQVYTDECEVNFSTKTCTVEFKRNFRNTQSPVCRNFYRNFSPLLKVSMRPKTWRYL